MEKKYAVGNDYKNHWAAMVVIAGAIRGFENTHCHTISIVVGAMMGFLIESLGCHS